MRVLALVESASHVCSRYRIEPYAWALAERGLQLEISPFKRGIVGRLAQLRGARRAAAVILQRKLLPIWQTALLRRSARRLIYDVDDAVFQRDSYSPKGPRSPHRMARFWATVSAADAVIVGNHYLKRRVASWVGPEKVRVIPTCIEPRSYRPARHRRTGAAAQLVWIGQSSTLASLARAREHLAAAAERLPGLRMRIICDRGLDLLPLVVEPRPWSAPSEAAELAAADIAVNWLPDDSWSRGKCGLKVLQYMAAGLPVVANPVGMNRRMVVSGRTGLLASTPTEWAEAIAELAGNPRRRARMGAAGRRRLQRRFGVSAWSRRFADVVEAVARHAPSAGPALPQIPAAALSPTQRRCGEPIT